MSRFNEGETALINGIEETISVAIRDFANRTTSYKMISGLIVSESDFSKSLNERKESENGTAKNVDNSEDEPEQTKDVDSEDEPEQPTKEDYFEDEHLLSTLKEKYFALFGKEVGKKYANNIAWISEKINSVQED